MSAVFFIFNTFYRHKIRKKGEAKIFLLLFCQLLCPSEALKEVKSE